MTRTIKKNQDKLGRGRRGPVVIDKAHPLAQCPNGFRISSHLQEIIAYLGSDYVFDEGSKLLKKLLDIDLSAKQLQKVSEHMAKGYQYCSVWQNSSLI